MSAPGKENAVPADQNGGFSKQEEHATKACGLQAMECPQMMLTKAWMRCDRTARLAFLTDVRAGAPNLWRDAERAFAAETGRRGL